MKTIAVVTQDEHDLAIQMEDRIMKLPESSGVLFASVKVIPDPEYCKPTFRITVGGSKDIEEKTLEAVVGHLFRDHDYHFPIIIEARRGIGRNNKATVK